MKNNSIRTLDILISILMLILTSPLIVLISLIIFLFNGKPIIFKQTRIGLYGKKFEILKFRTMKNKIFKNENERLTKFGIVLRRLSFDEIPQFFNVLKGEMSIVGPRPHMVEHDIYYSVLFDSFLKRHKCNPGITGWAQVNGLRGATPSPDVMERRMEFDLWYLNNWTISLDLYVIFKTFYAIFKHKGD